MQIGNTSLNTFKHVFVTWVAKTLKAKLVRYIISVLEVWYDMTFHNDGLRFTRHIYTAHAFFTRVGHDSQSTFLSSVWISVDRVVANLCAFDLLASM